MPPRGPLATMSTLAAEGQRQYIKSDGMDWAAKSCPAPPSRTMTHWSDTVTSSRYTVTFFGESNRSSDISAGEALTSLLLFFSVLWG